MRDEQRLLNLLVLLLVLGAVWSAAIEENTRGVVHGNSSEHRSQAGDYYAYEYSDEPLDTNASGRRVSWLIPDPDQLVARAAAEDQGEEEEDIDLPDDSLADGDLHDHDVMDSVMYIYFGPSPKGGPEGSTSAQVVLAGTAVALFAQVLTGLSAVRRAVKARCKRGGPVSLHAALALLHTELALATASLVFIFTVHGTGDPARCRAAALLLHYLHLSAACWLAANCLRVFLWLTREEARASLQAIAAAAWALPLLLVLTSLLIHPEGYESHHYCWLSVHKGMLVSFLIPLAALITATTGLAVSGVRGRYKAGPSEDAARLSLRLGAALLPLFAVSWFLGVLALEQPESIAAALLFAGTAALFNWLVFACSGALFPDCPSVLAARSPPPAPTLQHAGDAQPLLPACTSNASPNAWERGWTPSTHPERPTSPAPLRTATWRQAECSAADEAAAAAAEEEAEETSVLLELRLDPISTISA